MAKKKTKKTTTSGANNSDLSTALAEGEIKYTPQVKQVQGLLSDALGQYKGDVTAAKETAAAARSYARQAAPVIAGIYKDASVSTGQAQGDVARVMGTTSIPQTAAGDLFRVAGEREAVGARTRIAGAKARAEQELASRGQQASAGEQLALGEARRSYRGNVKSLQDKLVSLNEQKQADLVARLGQLGEQRANRDLKVQLEEMGNESALAVQNARDDAAAARDADKDKKDKAKGNRASAKDITKFSDTVKKAVSLAGDYTSRSEAAKELIEGSTPTGSMKTGDYIPGVPAIPQLALSVALDMRFDGHVSRANARALHARGLKVSDVVGAKSFQQWLNTPAGADYLRKQGGKSTKAGRQAGRDQMAERAAERK